MTNYASNDSKYITETHTVLYIHSDTVTTDRIQMARTHGPDALVAPVTRLSVRLDRTLTTAHQCTTAV